MRLIFEIEPPRVAHSDGPPDRGYLRVIKFKEALLVNAQTMTTGPDEAVGDSVEGRRSGPHSDRSTGDQ